MQGVVVFGQDRYNTRKGELMDERKKVEQNILAEEKALKECMVLFKTGLDPANWPRLQRRYIAQAFVPKDGPVNPEHAKGLRLMGLFYPGRTTFARVPEWTKEFLVDRDPDIEHIAERIRADMGKLIQYHREKIAKERS